MLALYSTCLFCTRDLERNTVLEAFPVGRRLAFDGAKGRLWVVCRKCERWNLSPIEERWEAIEAAERLFRATRMRASTGNIGLARHAEGLELVRIGSPHRPEFAAWRYGDQFGRRRRRAILMGGAAVGGVGLIAIAGLATGVISGSVMAQSGNFVNLWQNARTVVRLRTDSGDYLKLKLPEIRHARLQAGDDGFDLVLGGKRKERVFRGREAQRVAGLIVPRLNASGAGRAAVQAAVRELEAAGGPDAYLARLTTDIPLGLRSLKAGEAPAARLDKLSGPGRLALEMALHEEQERRALEGELKGLELAWQEAEEVAAIADDLLVPAQIRARLATPSRPNAADRPAAADHPDAGDGREHDARREDSGRRS